MQKVRTLCATGAEVPPTSDKYACNCIVDLDAIDISKLERLMDYCEDMTKLGKHICLVVQHYDSQNPHHIVLMRTIEQGLREIFERNDVPHLDSREDDERNDDTNGPDLPRSPLSPRDTASLFIAS